MLYNKETKIVSFENIGVFHQYKNDTGIKAVIYVEPREFHELEALHVTNIRKESASFGAYFLNESVFVYDHNDNAVKNADAFDILMNHKYINVTASFKILQVEDRIKGISYPIIAGNELRIHF